jgi:DNA-binding NtrC family response regulator
MCIGARAQLHFVGDVARLEEAAPSSSLAHRAGLHTAGRRARLLRYTRTVQPPHRAATTVPETAIVAPRGLHLVIFDVDGVKVRRLSRSRPLVVGRAPECDVRVTSPSVSRRHFSVLEADPPVVEDLQSANGTRISGQRLMPGATATVSVGAPIQAGGIFFVVQDHDPREVAPVAPAPEVSPESVSRPGVVVHDAAMTQLHALVRLVARSNLPVLVIGETGVGKEVVAESVHAHSTRAAKPFLKLNCAALPETLLESELFGYEKGAFSGATDARPGLIESADEGTLFLDEIGEMSPATQPKLLRVLESGELIRIGARKPRTVDVRVVAATNRALAGCVAAGTFRQDLYFRLNGFTISVPPLRDRASEIPLLAAHLLDQAAQRARRATPVLTAEALALLLRHSWPGNVRELKTVMERALAVCVSDRIGPQQVLIDPPVTATAEPAAPPASRPATASATAEGRLARIDPAEERRLLVQALERSGGNQTRAASALGISRRTLIHRMDAYGIPRPRKQDGER